MAAVLDFLKGAAQSFASPFEYLAKADIIDPTRELAAQVTNNQPAYQNAVRQSNTDLGLGPQGTDIGQGLRTWAGNAAQVGLDVAAPAIGKAVSRTALPAIRGAADVGASVAGRFGAKLASGAVRGAAEGAVLGGAQNVAANVTGNQQLNAKNLTMDFLQGAGAGATQGAVFGAATNPKAPLKASDAVIPGSLVFRKLQQFMGGQRAGLIDDEMAADIAKSTDPAGIEKKLEPVVGPQVAHDVAPALAHEQVKDPGIVQNIVKNDVQNKLSTSSAGNRPYASVQKAIEDAHNAGNDTEASRLIETQVPEADRPAMRSALGLPTPPAAPAGTMSPEELQSLFNSNPAGPPSGLPSEEQSIVQQGNSIPRGTQPGGYNYEPITTPSGSEPGSFITKPGEPVNPRTHVGSAAALSNAQDILNAGGSVSDAVDHYMMQTNSGMVEAKSAISRLMAETNPESLQRGNINASLNPRYEEGSKLVGKAELNDSTQPVNNSRTVYNAIIRERNQAMVELDKLSPADLKLMDETRNADPKAIAAKAEDRAQFLKAAKAVKATNDLSQGVESGMLGGQVPYRQNYGAPLLLDDSAAGKAATDQALARLKNTPGYAKGRFFNSYDEAASYGLQRKFDNFKDDFAYDTTRRANRLASQTLAKGLEEAYPGKVSTNGQIPVDENGTYKQLTIPGGERIAMPRAIADMINSREPASEASSRFGRLYDTLNSSYKNLKLGGGLFHMMNVGGTWLGQQLASGRLFTHPEDTAGMLRSIFSDKYMTDTVNELDKGGYLRAADQMGLTYGKHAVAADLEAPKAVDKLPGIKQLNDAVFGRQLPFMKLAALRQWMDANNIDPQAMTSDQVKQGTEVAKELNQNYGGLNRAIQGLTPQQFKILSRGLLATDYTEGQLRTLVDTFRPGADAAARKLAIQTVAGKALLFGMVATVGGLAGGEFKGKSPGQSALDIVQKAVDPRFNIGSSTVSLPETQASEFIKPGLEAAQNAASGKNWRTPLFHFATARLAALPSETLQLINNKDFYGNPLWGSDYWGRPISPLTAAMNVAGGVTPVPVSQGIQAAQGNESVPAAIANTAGAHVTPQYDLNYAPVAGQTYVQALKQQGAPKQQVASDTQFYVLLGQLSGARKQALKQAISDIGKKDVASAQKTIAAYNARLAKTLLPWSQSQGAKYLDATMMQQLRSSMITLSSANKSARQNIRTNPTAYGLPISASVLNQQAKNSVASGRTV